MRRTLIVEAISLARKADGVNCARQLGETRGRHRRRRLPIRIIGGRRRILRKGMQDIGEDQFLMLLLVIQADFEDAQHLRHHIFGGRQQKLDGLVDMGAKPAIAAQSGA